MGVGADGPFSRWNSAASLYHWRKHIRTQVEAALKTLGVIS